MAAVLISSTVAMPVMAAGGVGWSDDAKTPNPEIATEVTVDEWDGSDFSTALEYYDDSGDAATLPASLNDSNDNPVTLSATAIDFEDRNEFPRTDDEEDNSASALDADEWTESGATVSDSSTHAGVDALNFAGAASGDSATYSNFSVEDGEKTYLTLAADINDASGTPTVTLTDDDGDQINVTLYDSTANADDDDVVANETGDGMVFQHQLGDLDVGGSGDGSFDTTEEITVEGDVDADISVLDAERTRELTFGEREYENDDGDMETEEITEPRGDYSVTGMDTLDDVMSDATVNDVTSDAVFQASDLQDDEDVNAEFGESSDYPQWDQLGEIDYRLTLPTAFDVDYASPELRDEPTLPSERYKEVDVAEDTGDDDFEDIEGDSVSSSYDGSDEITLDSTVSTDTNYVISYQIVLTDGEVDTIQNAVDAGGAAVMDSSDGGIWGFLTSIPGIITSAIAGLGLARIFGGN